MTAQSIPLWPGERPLEQQVDRILRVDLAGERGAKRIYEGQLWVLKNYAVAPRIQHMYDQECGHAKGFEKRLKQACGRPTALSPVWHMAGFALGAFSAFFGVRAAMACTVAVEEVIDGHYLQQIEQLQSSNAPLAAFLEQCRQEEVSHKNQGYDLGAADLPFFSLFAAIVRSSTRLAIELSKRF